MSNFVPMPDTYDQARPVLERFIQEQAAAGTLLLGSSGRPNPPRNLIIQAGSQKVVLTWNGPQNMVGIVGWHVWKDTENNLVLTIDDVTTRQAQIQLQSNTNTGFFVSSFNALGIDSIKVQIIGKANTDQYVVAGTGGGTGGTTPNPPPEWPVEPGGGQGIAQ